MNKQNTKSINKNQVRLIEAEAFFNGTQLIPIENSVAETNADFAERQESVCRESAEPIKNLEGAIAVNLHRREDAENRWQMWREMTGGIVPPLASPMMKIFIAFAAMAGESVLLAPLMDLFGVKDYELQFVLAGVIVFVLALLVEIPIYLSRREFNRYAVYAVGTVIALGLISLGIFRAFGLEAIEAKKSPLISGFLSGNSTLSAIVIVFLTAGLPIGAAFAFELGWHGLSRWRQWRKARRDALKFARLHEISIKKLESRIEQRDRQIAALDEIREAWLAAKRQAHDEGARLKARRKPFWEIAFLLFGGCLLIAVLILAFAYIFCDDALSASIASDFGRFAFYAATALGAISLFAFFVIKRWNSPNASQLYADRTVVFHNESAVIPKLTIIKNDELDENSFIPIPAATVGRNGNIA